MNKSKEELQITLRQVEERILHLEQESAKDTTGVENLFHLGRVGGSGKPVKRLNQRREKILDRTIERSKELVPLYQQRQRLQSLINSYDLLQEQELRALQKREAALARLKTVKPGQHVMVFTGNMITVKRVNQKSITSISGTRWTFEELVDVVE